VAGYHETLLHKGDESGLVARFVGSAERIDAVRSSPDGKLPEVTGGPSGQEGEIQIWSVATRKLQRAN
jgi:hypothetical protein